MTDAEMVDKIKNATPAELIGMLYERCINDLNNAQTMFAADKVADGIHLVVHAQQIISELDHSLNKKESLAQNLSKIYEYMQYRLTEVVSLRDFGPLTECASLLSELHNTWKELVERQKNHAEM